MKRPENYLYFGLNGVTFGLGTGGAAPSWAANDYILNGGAQIVNGTATNTRLGRKILFTRLTARLNFFNSVTSDRVRVIIGVSRTSDAVSTLTSINAITAFVEGNAVLESPLSGAVLGPIDKAINPSSDYTILHDKIYGAGTAGGYNYVSNSSRMVAELDIPIMLQRTYDSTGVPDLGDWFIHICSDTPNNNENVSGYIRLEFINQWTWEGVGRSMRSFVTEAGNTLDHVATSKLAQYASRAAPYVFGGMV